MLGGVLPKLIAGLWRFEKWFRYIIKSLFPLQAGEAASVGAGEAGGADQHSHHRSDRGGHHVDRRLVTDGVPDQSADGVAAEAAATGSAAEATAG